MKKIRMFSCSKQGLSFFSVSGIALIFLLAPSVYAQTPTVLDVQVSAGSDDAYHSLGGWPGFNISGGNIYAGRPSGKDTYGGWRWTNVNIPSTATITSAYVEFRQKNWGGSLPTVLTFENAPVPATFSSNSTPFDRYGNKTLFELPWSWPNSTPNSWIQSPDLSAGIQELVNTHGDLTHIVLVEDGTPASSWHEWHGYDGGAASAAKLHIEYTSGPDVTPPVRSNGQPTGTLPAGTTQTDISLNTDENATCKYDTVAGTDFSVMPNIFATTGGTAHSTTVTGLEDGNTYSYYIRCEDEAGNANTDDFVISFDVDVPDTAPPVISSIEASPGATSALITWDTDEPATSQVEYGTTTALGSTSTLDTALVTAHSTTITGLSASTTYFYQVRSADASGNEAVEPATPNSFTTSDGSVVYPGATWDTRTSAEVGLDGALLDQFAASVGGNGAIVKDGYMVKTWGSETDKVRWGSGSKFVSALLMMFAAQEGKIGSADELLSTWGWNMSAEDEPMTFRHLSNNTSGYTLVEAPGEAWSYNDYSVNLFLKTVFNRVFNADPDTVALDPNRLGALQFEDGTLYIPWTDESWEVDASVRDMARIAWFMLNKGNWADTQLVSHSLFDDSVRPQVPETLPHTAGSDADGDYLGVGTNGGGNEATPLGPGVFGFYLWHNPNQSFWPDVPADAYQANGHWNGEVVTIIPSRNTVVLWNACCTGDSESNFNEPMNADLKILMDAFLDETPPSAPANLGATATGQTISLSWDAASDPESSINSYRVYRDTASGTAKTLIGEIAGTQLTYDDTTGLPNTTYYYDVSALNSAGLESGRSNEASATTGDDAPAAPTGLSAGGGDQTVHVNWDDNAEADLAGYHIYRAETAGGPHTEITTSLLVSSDYTDTNVVNGTTYYYVITAEDTGGNESASSTEVSATPSDLPVVLDAQVATSSDDAFHAPSGWPGYSSTGQIYAGRPNSQIVWGGWRWTGFNIPAGATILTAYVELRQKEWGNEFPTNLAFENSPTPATFSSGSTPADRWSSKTAFTVQWSWPKATPDTWIQTPELKDGIQELVNTHGGIGDLVFLEDGSPATGGNYHVWKSFDGGGPAKLHVEYQNP